LAERPAAAGRPRLSITAAMLTAVTGDPALPDHGTLVGLLSDPDGMYGIPADQISSVLVTGGPDQVAGHLAALAEAGADRVVVSIAAGDWHRQTELLAEAHARLPNP
jgi:alkanesulfonate monooxygenase SsuD/methylene tetrahydromethanopterin reductase-like flavin-dependent oxidoreductase (luciferase family)